MQEVPRHGLHCAGCGDGVATLGMTFARDEHQHVFGSLNVDERHQGAPGFVHGGILAAAFDEVLGTRRGPRGRG